MSDPRPRLAASLDQTERLVERACADDVTRATPCGDFDVRTLTAHLVAVLRKLTVVRSGGDMTTVADPADDLPAEPDALVGAWCTARGDFQRVWVVGSVPADAEVLDQDFTLAWGTMTGRELLDAYTHEFTVHAWDLARTTDREGELDPVLAEAALAWFRANVSAEDRVAGGPFGPVVPVPAEADVHTRLAGFVGREPEPFEP